MLIFSSYSKPGFVFETFFFF